MKKFFETLFNWERWNFFVLYAPISPVWIWYCLRSGSLWYFSSSNPTITFGGFEGEGKKEMYDQLPPELYPRTIYIKPGQAFDEVKQQLADTGFTYPFIVKPDVGMKGILFRKLDNEEQLKKYHERIPVEYIIQALVDWPVEVSVFYYRHPAEQKGTVSGFIYKELLHVVGDGSSTLQQLVETHPRAKFRLAEMKHRHGHCFSDVIPDQEIFYLSYAGNHNRGAQFTNLHNEINQEMHDFFDALSHKTQFFYGRYDIKTSSIEDLKQGKNISILEFNGCGAEPNHIYDCGMPLWKAYATLLKHWKALYQISRHNHLNGTPYWSYRRGKEFLKESNKHFKVLEQYD